MPEKHEARERFGSQTQTFLGENRWAYYATLLVAVILLIALGWFAVIRHTRALTETAIRAYQETELEIARAAARSTQRYVHDQIEIHGRVDIVEVEQEIVEQFIRPIRLLEHGTAWIYAPDHIVFDPIADFPDESQGKSMAEIFAIQAENGASHYKEMVEAVTNAREGRDWYIWLPDKGKEVAAWTPVRVEGYVWTIGISTPLSEILASTDIAEQTRSLAVTMGMGILLALFLLIVWGLGTRQRWYTEKALRESENKFRQAFHYANDAMYLWNLQLGKSSSECIEANDVACRMLGYSKAEFATLSVHDLITEESGRKISGIKQDLVTKGQSTFETIHVAKDGREIPAEVSSHLFTLGGENVILAIVRDVTERKQSEEELRKLNASLEARVAERTVQLEAQYARLDAILNSTIDGIVVADKVGDIVQANPVVQKWLAQTLSFRETSLLREAIRRVATQTGGATVESLELPEQEMDLELSGAPIWGPTMEDASGYLSGKSGAGDPAMVVGIHDVSHLKALDRMKTLFVANVSDELSQPVATIKAFVYLVQATSLDNQKWSPHLDALSQEVDAVEQLVKDIRRISSIYTGRLQLDCGALPLNKLTMSIIVNHRYLAQTNGLSLEHRPAEPELIAMADPDQMVQVLNCLVGDAVRYTPGGGRVVISIGSKEANGRRWATVSVSDTGEVIPKEDMTHIFERLLRDEEPRNKRVFDTGLRLMLTKEIVALHGGRLTVESPSPILSVGEDGVGSTFTVWLDHSE